MTTYDASMQLAESADMMQSSQLIVVVDGATVVDVVGVVAGVVGVIGIGVGVVTISVVVVRIGVVTISVVVVTTSWAVVGVGVVTASVSVVAEAVVGAAVVTATHTCLPPTGLATKAARMTVAKKITKALFFIIQIFVSEGNQFFHRAFIVRD